MMQLKDYRLIFIAVGSICVLLSASPTIAILVPPQPGEQFSSIYILGPTHTFDGIPSNVKPGTTYSVLLGVADYMGSSIYYTCSVKLATQSDSLPNSTLGTASSLPALYEFKTLISDGKIWETPLTFQVNKIAFTKQTSTISDLSINGLDYSINKTSSWDSNGKGYYYILFVELSIYNSTLGLTRYDNRYVSLYLNMTQ